MTHADKAMWLIGAEGFFIVLLLILAVSVLRGPTVEEQELDADILVRHNQS